MKLFLKNVAFTLVIPGTFAVLIPLLIAGDRTACGGWTLAVALVLFGVGVSLYVRSVWDFASFGRGTPAPIDAPKRLVVRGFYRYTRNPMYVAALTVISGWATLFGASVLLAYAAIVFIFFSLFVQFYEEPRLTREFGDEYTAYMAKVGRWLPRRPLSDTRRIKHADSR